MAYWYTGSAFFQIPQSYLTKQKMFSLVFLLLIFVFIEVSYYKEHEYKV